MCALEVGRDLWTNPYIRSTSVRQSHTSALAGPVDGRKQEEGKVPCTSSVDTECPFRNICRCVGVPGWGHLLVVQLKVVQIKDTRVPILGSSCWSVNHMIGSDYRFS